MPVDLRAGHDIDCVEQDIDLLVPHVADVISQHVTILKGHPATPARRMSDRRVRKAMRH